MVISCFKQILSSDDLCWTIIIFPVGSLCFVAYINQVSNTDSVSLLLSKLLQVVTSYHTHQLPPNSQDCIDTKTHHLQSFFTCDIKLLCFWPANYEIIIFVFISYVDLIVIST
jgi:hypothetical protein